MISKRFGLLFYLKKPRDEAQKERAEFIDLHFQDGKLKLRTINNEMRAISEVSTGQRSALALSLFISLNKKKSVK
jgi:hypothetical protein